MAVNELSGFLKYKDANGDLNLLYPITTKDNVDGIDDIEAEVAETVKFTAQALDDARKAQARTNIGAGTSNVELSTDLATTGRAADAKVVGDALIDMKIYVDDAVANPGEITLTDRTTGVKYTLYADNGKLMMIQISE